MCLLSLSTYLQVEMPRRGLGRGPKAGVLPAAWQAWVSLVLVTGAPRDGDAADAELFSLSWRPWDEAGMEKLCVASEQRPTLDLRCLRLGKGRFVMLWEVLIHRAFYLVPDSRAPLASSLKKSDGTSVLTSTEMVLTISLAVSQPHSRDT